MQAAICSQKSKRIPAQKMGTLGLLLMLQPQNKGMKPTPIVRWLCVVL